MTTTAKTYGAQLRERCNFGHERRENLEPWQNRHRVAWAQGGAIRAMLEAWADYADGHSARYEESVGADYFLGVEWANIGKGIRALLNGETGALDCGTLDGFLVDTLTAEGFEV